MKRSTFSPRIHQCTHHGPLGDGVLDLREGDAHAKLGGDEGEGVARGLRRQC